MRGKDEEAYFWMAIRISEMITGLKLGRLELCPGSFVYKLSDWANHINTQFPPVYFRVRVSLAMSTSCFLNIKYEHIFKLRRFLLQGI